jgi:anti-sigma regulatory factor (Ser/Thr protein kinase)
MSMVLTLPYDAASPLLARRFVEQYAAERSLDGATPVLAMIASELVTNAIVHGAAPVELSLRYEDGAVTIEVSDGDSRTDAVQPREPDRAGPGGRGLGIVAFLADRWGTRSLPSGKAVWVTVRTTHP